MILVLTICAVLWGIGWAMKAPIQQRLVMIGLVFVAVITIHLTLPFEHPLRQNTGYSWKVWAYIAGFIGLILAYFKGVKWLRGKADTSYTPNPNAFTDTELDRYARHIVMPEIGGVGQRKLKAAKVLVIGAGGLGSPALQYLAAAGVGTIGIVDDDMVDATNLQRQIIHRDADVGRPKVESAKDAITALNPYVGVAPYQLRLSQENAAELIRHYDIVLDGTDNFDTRYLVNKTCVALQKPLISGALSQWEGQVTLFDPATSGPCYECLFPVAPEPGMTPTCAEAGVFAALPGVIGTQMAAEALKYIIGAGTPLLGRMAIHSVLDAETRTLKTNKRMDCPICATSKDAP